MTPQDQQIFLLKGLAAEMELSDRVKHYQAVIKSMAEEAKGLGEEEHMTLVLALTIFYLEMTKTL